MKMNPHGISPQEHARITAAIRAAEARTDGEIYCVVARASDGYFFPAALTVTLAMLIAGLVVAYGLEAWWLTIRLPHFIMVELVAIACALALLWTLPGLRIHLVPRHLRYEAAHANAVRQFLARNVHVTVARTGVLVFVSLAERYAEVIADAGIDGKVDQHIWDGVVRDLTAQAGGGSLADGFVQAIEAVGAVLAEHFPISRSDSNELDDHLVEI